MGRTWLLLLLPALALARGSVLRQGLSSPRVVVAEFRPFGAKRAIHPAPKRTFSAKNADWAVRAYCLTTAAAPFLKTYFWILPVAVFGSSDTNVTPCGALKWASLSRVKAMSSASVADAPGLSTTYA